MNQSKSGIAKMVLLASIYIHFLIKLIEAVDQDVQEILDLLPKKVNIILLCVIFLLISIIDDFPLLYIYFLLLYVRT